MVDVALLACDFLLLLFVGSFLLFICFFPLDPLRAIRRHLVLSLDILGLCCHISKVGLFETIINRPHRSFFLFIRYLCLQGRFSLALCDSLVDIRIFDNGIIGFHVCSTC